MDGRPAVFAFVLVVVAALFGAAAGGVGTEGAASGMLLTRIARTVSLAWRDYAVAVEAEMSALKEIALETADSTGFSQRVLRRVHLANMSYEGNRHVIEAIIGAVEDAAEQRLFGEIGIFGDQSDDTEGLDNPQRLIIRGPQWLRTAGTADCANLKEGDTPQVGGYGTVYDLFVHLARDWAPRTNPASRAVHEHHLVPFVETIVRATAASSVRPRVLVPGSGAGGLQSLLVASGEFAEVIGTECSPVLVAAQMWLDQLRREWRSGRGDPHARIEFAPFAGTFSNVFDGLKEDDQFARFEVDVQSLSATSTVSSLLVADVFSGTEEIREPIADVLVTCFLIDAISHSSFSANPRRAFIGILERVDALIEPGGLWANLGPLHFHSSEMLPKLSVDEIVAYFVDTLGYEVLEPPRLLSEPLVPYSRPFGSSMTPQIHTAAAFVLRKSS